MLKTDLSRRTGLLLALLVAACGAHAAAPNQLPGLQPPPSASTPASASTTTPQASWATMTPAQRRELRARYAAWRALPETERQRIRHAATSLASKSNADQAGVRAQFQNMDQMHRDGWLLGPQLGITYVRLQPLLGYLPQDQREPMLTLLRQLEPTELELLSLISLRTPPQGREALRSELLAVPAAQREAWLRAKVGG